MGKLTHRNEKRINEINYNKRNKNMAMPAYTCTVILKLKETHSVYKKYVSGAYTLFWLDSRISELIRKHLGSNNDINVFNSRKQKNQISIQDFRCVSLPCS